MSKLKYWDGGQWAVLAPTNAEFIAHLADYVRQPGFGTTTGSANTYAVTLNPALSAYADGVAIAVKINASNTGASTINVNGLGAKSIVDSKGNALTTGKLLINSVYSLRYNGTNFILQGEGASGDATASDLLSGKTATVDAGEITGTMPNRTGHVTAQSSSVNGTTLRFRPQAGFYPGDTGNSAQLSDVNFIAGNILSGVSIFGLTGAFSNIKSIQRGSVSFPAANTSLAVTITAVNTVKAIPRIIADGSNTGTDVSAYTIDITSSTQITIERNSTDSIARTIYWEVIEFENVKSLQKGSGIYATGDTATITAVVMGKSLIFVTWRRPGGGNTFTPGEKGFYFVSSTQIRAVAPGSSTTFVWFVIEFN